MTARPTGQIRRRADPITPQKPIKPSEDFARRSNFKNPIYKEYPAGAHALTHFPISGTDPIGYDVPVSVGLVNAPGSADFFSLSDHVHMAMIPGFAGEPAGVSGQLIYDTNASLVKRYSGAAWVRVGPVKVEEIDGTPTVAGVVLIKVTNGKLTDNGGGSITLDLTGVPGGLDTYVQFNSAGSFGGAAGFTYAAGVLTAPNFVSSIAIGTKPYACTSTTMNTNLNADLLDGNHAAAFLAVGGTAADSDKVDGYHATAFSLAAHHHYELWESDDGAVAMGVDAAGRVWIGNNSAPVDRLHLSGDQATRMYLDTYSSVGPPEASFIVCRRARDTKALPIAVAALDLLGGFTARGFGTTVWGANNVAAILYYAEGAFTDVSQPTYMAFGTTPTGSITRAERMRITADGQVGIGKTPTTYKLEVNGEIQGTGYRSSDGTAGASFTKAFTAADAKVNTVVVKNGLIVSWTQV